MIIKGVYIHLPRPPSPFTRSITIAILNWDQYLADFQVWSHISHKSDTYTLYYYQGWLNGRNTSIARFRQG